MGRRATVVELPRFRGQLSAFESRTLLVSSSSSLKCKRGVRGVSPRVPPAGRARERFVHAAHADPSAPAVDAAGWLRSDDRDPVRSPATPSAWIRSNSFGER